MGDHIIHGPIVQINDALAAQWTRVHFALNHLPQTVGMDPVSTLSICPTE